MSRFLLPFSLIFFFLLFSLPSVLPPALSPFFCSGRVSDSPLSYLSLPGTARQTLISLGMEFTDYYHITNLSHFAFLMQLGDGLLVPSATLLAHSSHPTQGKEFLSVETRFESQQSYRNPGVHLGLHVSTQGPAFSRVPLGPTLDCSRLAYSTLFSFSL